MLNSKRNKAVPTLLHSIFLLENESGRVVGDTCLLQYHLSDGTEKVEIDVQKHGNYSKMNPKPFQPMKKSSLREMQESIKSQPSRGVYITTSTRTKCVIHYVFSFQFTHAQHSDRITQGTLHYLVS